MARLIYINNEKYNKKSFTNRLKKISSLPVGKTIINQGDIAFLKEAISYNPSWKKILDKYPSSVFKITKKKFQRSPVKGIVMVTPSNKQIWIGKQRLLDFVFPRRINELKEKRNRSISALRQIVDDQILDYRKQVNDQINKKSARCAISGKFLYFGEFHIDHKIPFKELVENWCRHNAIDLENIETICRGTRCRLKDKNLANDFYEYHKENAILQPTTIESNLKKGSKIL